MRPIIRLFAALLILSLGLLACNLPSNTSSTQPVDLSNALTSAVQTVQAASQPAPTSVSASTALPAATPSTPIVTVSSATNCRTGPDPSYPLVLTFQPGATAVVVGKYTPANYWVIQTPTGGTCWLWGAYATVQGNADALAEMAPPTPAAVAVAPTSGSSSSPKPSPTPTSKSLVLKPILLNPGIIKVLTLPPAAPSKLTVSTTCTYNVFHILTVRTDKLSWTAVSNATGYYVFENGSKNPPGGTTGTSINLIATTTTGNVSFGVAAYNSWGASGTTSTSSHC
jgi:hypothetical protein